MKYKIEQNFVADTETGKIIATSSQDGWTEFVEMVRRANCHEGLAQVIDKVETFKCSQDGSYPMAGCR